MDDPRQEQEWSCATSILRIDWFLLPWMPRMEWFGSARRRPAGRRQSVCVLTQHNANPLCCTGFNFAATCRVLGKSRAQSSAPEAHTHPSTQALILPCVAQFGLESAQGPRPGFHGRQFPRAQKESHRAKNTRALGLPLSPLVRLLMVKCRPDSIADLQAIELQLGIARSSSRQESGQSPLFSFILAGFR